MWDTPLVQKHKLEVTSYINIGELEDDSSNCAKVSRAGRSWTAESWETLLRVLDIYEIRDCPGILGQHESGCLLSACHGNDLGRLPRLKGHERSESGTKTRQRNAKYTFACKSVLLCICHDLHNDGIYLYKSNDMYVAVYSANDASYIIISTTYSYINTTDIDYITKRLFVQCIAYYVQAFYYSYKLYFVYSRRNYLTRSPRHCNFV